jgi:hypothetical protein
VEWQAKSGLPDDPRRMYVTGLPGIYSCPKSDLLDSLIMCRCAIQHYYFFNIACPHIAP